MKKYGRIDVLANVAGVVAHAALLSISILLTSRTRSDVVCNVIERFDHFRPHNHFPAQSLHFRFGSVAPCPTLKSNVTVLTPRTRYRQLAKPYPAGFSCYIQSAYKSKQGFLCSLEEISYADFSARTIHIV